MDAKYYESSIAPSLASTYPTMVKLLEDQAACRGGGSGVGACSGAIERPVLHAPSCSSLARILRSYSQCKGVRPSRTSPSLARGAGPLQTSCSLRSRCGAPEALGSTFVKRVLSPSPSFILLVFLLSH